MTDLPIDNRKLKIKVTRGRSDRRQTQIKKTKEELEKRKRELEEADKYIQRRINEFKTSWNKFYFGSPESYVTLLDYKERYAHKINPVLKGKPINRIERQYLTNIKECLSQISQVTDHLDKKYKQDLIDSHELTYMIRTLLQLEAFSNHVKIDTYNFASDLFYITLKILIDKAPNAIQNQLIESIEKFIELNNLPLELGYKKGQKLAKLKIISNRDGKKELQLNYELLSKS